MQEIEKIINYLPYGVRYMATHYNPNKSIDTLGSVGIIHKRDYFSMDGYTSNNVKLILRPLEDLTKEELQEFSVCFRMHYNKPNFDVNLMIYSDVNLAYKKHIDIHNLIKSGQAIDINTLER